MRKYLDLRLLACTSVTLLFCFHNVSWASSAVPNLGLPQFKILIDVNELHNNEAPYVSLLAADGVWSITENSPDIPASAWPGILSNLNAANWSVSEDLYSGIGGLGPTYEFTQFKNFFPGRVPNGAFVYLESNLQQIHNIPTLDEIRNLSAEVGNRIIVLSRDYNPGDPRTDDLNQAMREPSVAGAVFEVTPIVSNLKAANINAGISACLSTGKKCYVLLAPGTLELSKGSYLINVQLAMQYFMESKQLNNPNLHFVLAAYSRKDSGVGFFTPDKGQSTNTILAAVNWLRDNRAALASGGPVVFPPPRVLDYPKSTARISFSDFNGDGFGDIPLQNGSTLALWQMNGNTVIGGGNIGSLGTSWSVAGVGDFNGDGRADFLLQNQGQLAVWLMNGPTILAGSGNLPNPIGEGWYVAGIGDFNGDGKSDILFRSGNLIAIWTMNGATNLPSSNLISDFYGNVALVSTEWSIAGVGDFDGDHRADILLQNGNQLAIWKMDITNNRPTVQNLGAGTVSQKLDLGWAIVGIGDFNKDGKADILLRKSNQLAIWLMNLDSNGATAQKVGGGTLLLQLDAGSTVIGIGDFNNDGKADILLRNVYQLRFWYTNSTTIFPTSATVTSTLNSAWNPL